MELIFKPAAQENLENKIAAGAYVFLATDDGSSKFSKLGGTCAIGNKFQLVVSDRPDETYTIPMENNMDYHLFTSDGELDYLSTGLNMDYKNASLMLKDDSGILDGAVSVTPLEDAALAKGQARKDQMDALGNQIC